MIKLNQNPIIELDYLYLRDFVPPEVKYSFYCKNERLERVFKKLHPDCQEVLARMQQHISRRKKYQYVFIKSELVKENQQISNGLWHLDSELNGAEFENYIYIDSNSPTEFIKTPLEIEEAKNSLDFDNKIKQNRFDTFQINRRTIYKYDGYSVHRGPKAIQNEIRLLIRLQNTDYKMKPYKAYRVGLLT